MTILEMYAQGGLLILAFMAAMWLTSIILKNVSIVDSGWGFGFVLLSWLWFLQTNTTPRGILLVTLVTIWGLRLTIYITWRNWGKGEDYRYQNFRKNFGPKYWWFSFFQTFLLQGILMLLIASPLLMIQLSSRPGFGLLDYVAILLWMIGFLFESVGDIQLSLFKRNPQNKGKVMNRGLWRYTRHPNYFGDAVQWWAFGLLSVAAGFCLPLLSSLLMTVLLLKVSGVALLEKGLSETKPGYEDYIKQTSPFIPRYPKKLP